jgi:glucose-6-phosphate isomerase
MATRNKFNPLKAYDKIIEQIGFKIEDPLLSYYYDNSGITKEHLAELQIISNDLLLTKKLTDIQNGKPCNKTIPANHYLCRQLHKNSPYNDELKHCFLFSNKLHAHEYLSAKKKPFLHVVQIGIGGSHLGPKAAYTFFDSVFCKENKEKKLSASFISNCDPIEFKLKMRHISADQTLFIIASKSGNTQETLMNVELLKDWASKEGLSKEDLKQQCIIISCKDSDLIQQDIANQHFFIDEPIGGRFSLSSVIGCLLLTLCFGQEPVLEFLNGANEQDLISQNDDITKNSALLAALISVYYTQVMGFNTHAIVPYCYPLSVFPAHLQQLICESNGKNHDLNGNRIDYPTSPLIFGSAGTNAQHSFFQLLHQGTQTIPIEFISCNELITDSSLTKAASHKLLTNLKGQIQAFREGDNHLIPGNKPTTHIELHELSIKHFGALLAFYENKTAFQGLIWGINSFDQPAVQLGKTLTNQLLIKSN